MRKADEDALKAFISRRMDRARLAYERTTSEFPRQSVFIATKNPRADGAYLRDDTGNRRWWPVRCRGVGKFGQVDFAGLKAARNQLFAETVVLCGRQPAGEALYMDTIDLKDSAKSVVDQRRTPHEWTEVIAEWLDSEQPIEMVTLREVYHGALKGADLNMTRAHILGIASVLRSLGWEQRVMRRNGRPTRVWIPALPAEVVAEYMTHI
jgi:predicted P-loop ATPase